MPGSFHAHDIRGHGTRQCWLPGCTARRRELAKKAGLLARTNHAQVARQKAIRLIDEEDKPLLSQDGKGQRQNKSPSGQR
jgi:hypothetical protein